MTVEIRELVIRAVVSDSNNSNENFMDQNESDNEPDMEKETVIEECVKQVLKILKRNGGR